MNLRFLAADLPAILLTYDFYDRAERSAVRALVGDAPITGRLPMGLPGVAERGPACRASRGRQSGTEPVANRAQGDAAPLDLV